MAGLFRRPPEIIWVGIAAGLAIWGIVAVAPVTLVACGAFLGTQFLALPRLRLPLSVVFVAACLVGAVLALGGGDIIDVVIWGVLAFLGLYEINEDFTALSERT